MPSLFQTSENGSSVYLSRFCEVRYCIARHVGFLVGYGYPAGDSSCLPQKVESILPLLRRALPRGDELLSLLSLSSLRFLTARLSSLSSRPDSAGEQGAVRVRYACLSSDTATHRRRTGPCGARWGSLHLEQLRISSWLSCAQRTIDQGH